MLLRNIVLTALYALPSSALAADTGVDFSFAQSGWRRMYESGGGTQDEKAVAFARTADGGYVIAAELPGGGANGGTGKRIGLFRLDRDGNYVASGFGDNGKVVKDAWLSSVTDMTIDAQGRIVVVGSTPGQGGAGDFGVVRFNANGSDDTSFAGDGGTSFAFDVTSIDTDDAPTSVLADPDGRIVVAGSVHYSIGEQRFGVVRFNADGTQDSTFGSIGDGHGGSLGTTDKFVDGKDAYASRILRIAGGYYVVAGTSVYSSTDTDFAARIPTPSGGPWSGFVGSATFPVDEPGPGGSLYDTLADAVLADPTTIVLVGSASGRFAALRIKAGTENGSSQYTTLASDPTFVGHAATAGCNDCYVGSTAGSSGQSAAIRSDGRIVMVGDTVQLRRRPGIARRRRKPGRQLLHPRRPGHAAERGRHAGQRVRHRRQRPDRRAEQRLAGLSHAIQAGAVRRLAAGDPRQRRRQHFVRDRLRRRHHAPAIGTDLRRRFRLKRRRAGRFPATAKCPGATSRAWPCGAAAASMRAACRRFPTPPATFTTAPPCSKRAASPSRATTSRSSARSTSPCTPARSC